MNELLIALLKDSKTGKISFGKLNGWGVAIVIALLVWKPVMPWDKYTEQFKEVKTSIDRMQVRDSLNCAEFTSKIKMIDLRLDTVCLKTDYLLFVYREEHKGASVDDYQKFIEYLRTKGVSKP